MKEEDKGRWITCCPQTRTHTHTHTDTLSLLPPHHTHFTHFNRRTGVRTIWRRVSICFAACRFCSSVGSVLYAFTPPPPPPVDAATVPLLAEEDVVVVVVVVVVVCSLCGLAHAGSSSCWCEHERETMEGEGREVQKCMRQTLVSHACVCVCVCAANHEHLIYCISCGNCCCLSCCCLSCCCCCLSCCCYSLLFVLFFCCASSHLPCHHQHTSRHAPQQTAAAWRAPWSPAL